MPQAFLTLNASIERSNPAPNKLKSRKHKCSRDFTWLSIKNDYRTLIGADELDLVEKAEDEDDEDSNA